MTTNQGTNQDSQLIEETLNRTDLGHIINENKKVVLILSAIVIIGLLIFSVFNHQNTASNLSFLDDVYDVKQSVFLPAIEKKISADEYKKLLSEMNQNFIGHPNLVLSFIEALNALGKDAYADDTLLKAAYTWRDKISPSNGLYLFIQLRIAVLEENLGKVSEAAQTYEMLVGNKFSFMKDKVLAELVRLYMNMNDTTKANERYETLKKDFPDSQYVDLALMHLKGL